LHPSAGTRAIQARYPLPVAAVLAVLAEQVNHYQTGGLKEINIMIQTQNPEIKTEINHRLARIEGQLRGVQKMINEDRDCRAILQQLIAIRAGVQSASLKFIQDVANDCILHIDSDQDFDNQKEQLAELIHMLGKFS
jgi:DNA-binding FrmR family transcriptional regulator